MCIFCGKESEEEIGITSSQGVIRICPTCQVLLMSVLNDTAGNICAEAKAEETKAEDIVFELTPSQINNYLNDWVIGQDEAKKAVSVAIYNHYKRIMNNAKQIKKSNILMAGPTGCGKTEIARTVAKLLNVPFAIADATTLTEAGYVGDDVENIILRLIQSADGDIEKAEKGIIYIDEIDKICRKSENTSITRDVSGEGVQQALLKIIEGAEVDVPVTGGRKHPNGERVRINTENILFICGGAFESLTMKEPKKETRPLGFNASYEEEKTTNKLTPHDIIKQGLIPELVGRLPIIVELKKLTEKDLLDILTKTKESIIKQYTDLIALDGVTLTFTEKAIKHIAHKAYENNMGARGLKSIIEDEMLNLMYTLPDEKDVHQVLVDVKKDILTFKKAA